MEKIISFKNYISVKVITFVIIFILVITSSLKTGLSILFLIGLITLFEIVLSLGHFKLHDAFEDKTEQGVENERKSNI